jgi:predicted NUDIX family phosphoesterase
LGVAYIVDLKTDDVKIDKRELASGRFVNIQEAKKILSDPNIEVESWSKILLQVILN